MIKEAIELLRQDFALNNEELEGSMEDMLTGQAKEEEIAEYLTLLAERGETYYDIVPSVKVMRQHCYKLPQQPHTMEVVGTGGDKSNSFNISTTTAILLAAAGVPIAKHGNRAASSQCGSADVLEALGVNIDIPPEKSLDLLAENNICFLFAQTFHPAMKYVAPVRRKLGFRTLFNLLGPLTNPLGARKILLGVSSEDLVQTMAKALVELDIESGMVVHGRDGLDEFSLTAPSFAVSVYKKRKIFSYKSVEKPDFYGLPYCTKEDLMGGSPQVNADITRRIFAGEKFPCRDAVLWNAAHAMATYRLPRDESFLNDVIKDLQEVLDSGKAMKTLENFIRLSNS